MELPRVVHWVSQDQLLSISIPGKLTSNERHTRLILLSIISIKESTLAHTMRMHVQTCAYHLRITTSAHLESLEGMPVRRSTQSCSIADHQNLILGLLKIYKRTVKKFNCRSTFLWGDTTWCDCLSFSLRGLCHRDGKVLSLPSLPKRLQLRCLLNYK